MVLKKNGFTVIELMVALALSGIVMALAYQMFLSSQSSMFHRQAKKQEQFNISRFLEGLSQSLIVGKGIYEMEENSISWENQSGIRKRLFLEDSILRINEDSLLFSIAQINIRPYTPLAEPVDFFSEGNKNSLLNYYEKDGDYLLEFDEMDLNGNGKLDVNECKLVSLIELKIVWNFRGTEKIYGFTVHPRNRTAFGDSFALESQN